MSKLTKLILMIAASVIVVSLSIALIVTSSKKTTLSFVTNYDEVVESIKGKRGEELELPSLSRVGYNFLGWFLDKDLIEKANLDKFPKSDMKLYAGWELIHFEVIYELDGGINNNDNPNTITIIDEVTLNNPSKTGWTFVGWYDNKNLSGNKIEKINKGTSNNIKLYAAWTTDANIDYQKFGTKQDKHGISK